MSTISVEVPVLQPAEQSRYGTSLLSDAAAIATAARNPALDAARVIAALGLVWVHATRSSLLKFHIFGRFGTSFFVLAAIFFLFHRLGTSQRPTYGAYIWKRFRRLYIPFAAWSLIYLFVRDIKRFAVDEPPLTMQWGRLIAGTSMQFWFLPFILIACAVCFPLPPLIARMGRWKYLLLPFIIGAGAFIAFSTRPATPRADEVTNYFLDSVWVFSPSIFWALALAIVYPLLPQALRQSRALALIGLSLTAGCIIYLWLIRHSANPLPSLPRTLAGVGWLLVALAPLRGRIVTLLAPLGKYSYGVFLIHPLFVMGFATVFRSAHVAPAGWLDLLVVAMAFPASVALTALLRAHRATRWLVP